MKRLDSVLLKVFLSGIPAAVGLGLFAYFFSSGGIEHGGIHEFLNGLAGLVIALWMILTIILGVRLVVSGPFRDAVLSRITFMRERDERESMLTGKAVKTAFLTTLSLLILLFFLSCIQVSIYRVPPEQAVGGKTGFVTLGLGFNILEQSDRSESEIAGRRENIFSYRGLPVSNTAVILALIIWQVVSYNLSIRRLMR
jgi:hypothetical protein